MSGAPSVKDLKLSDEAKDKRPEPWHPYVNEAKEDIEEFRKSLVKQGSGYCRVLQRGGQGVDLWGFGTLKDNVIEVKVMYGMGGYPPGKYYSLQLTGWDVMWTPKEFFTEVVASFKYQAIEDEKRKGGKAENDAMLEREAKIQGDLEKKRVEVMKRDLDYARNHPWKFAFKKFWEDHVVKDMSPEEDLSPSPSPKERGASSSINGTASLRSQSGGNVGMQDPRKETL